MMTPDQRTIRNLRRHLRELTATVAKAITAIDAEMQLPSTFERGQRVARICNTLEMANDSARHFGLGQRLDHASTRRLDIGAENEAFRDEQL